MKGLKKIFLLGHVGAEPDVRATQSGGRIAKFSLATSRSYKDASDTKREETQWHSCVAFGRLVDVIEQWVKKGDRLLVEGRIEYSQTEKDGQKRYWTNCVIGELTMLGSQERAPEDEDQSQGW